MKQFHNFAAASFAASINLRTFLLLPGIVLVLGVAGALGQTSNEFFSSSMSGIAAGPSNQSSTARLVLNSDHPGGDTTGTTTVNVSVTASVSNQQYTGFSTGAGNPVVMFGGTNVASSGGPASVPVFGAMNGGGSPASNQFSNTVAGTAAGLNVAVNHAFDMYTSVRHWGSGAAPATNSRVQMADLILTFSSPVTNPRLHFVGLGGTSGGLGFGSEFDLLTPGLTLTKIQGNTALAVTSTQVNNGTASGIAPACTGNAGCGTVRVNGSNITTITFRVYVRGDGGAAAWAGTTSHAGDRFLIGVSLPESYTVSGTVYNDTDGSGTVNGIGIGQPNGTQLYANLVDPTDNTVVASVPVNADGTYSFAGVPGGGVNYRVEISVNQGTPLSPAPAKVLPGGWVNVAEHQGAGAGNDGSSDGRLNVALGSANSSTLNFGIAAAGTTSGEVTIAGRVRTWDGRGIRNVVVALIREDGVALSTLTGTFGYYSFEGLPAGRPVILSVRAKRFSLR